jgi:hypothetical protein
LSTECEVAPAKICLVSVDKENEEKQIVRMDRKAQNSIKTP